MVRRILRIRGIFPVRPPDVPPFEQKQPSAPGVARALQLSEIVVQPERGRAIVFTNTLPKLLPDTHEPDVRLARTLGGVCAFLRETACGVRGHDYLLHTSGTRLYLRCANCGQETPGWRTGANVGGRTGVDEIAAPSSVGSNSGRR